MEVVRQFVHTSQMLRSYQESEYISHKVVFNSPGADVPFWRAILPPYVYNTFVQHLLSLFLEKHVINYIQCFPDSRAFRHDVTAWYRESCCRLRDP